jgi:MFS family permease
MTTTLREPVKRISAAAAGMPARKRILLLLGCVLALDTADASMVGAIAGQLEDALRLTNTQLGLLAASPSVMGALATMPVGVLTDRTRRVTLLGGSVLLWGLAMIASGVSGSFEMLLLTRLGLGIATASAGPAVSSLVGDYFPSRERGRVYGLILSGELLGGGVGFLVSGELGTVLTWRAAFLVLALPSLILGIAILRALPEPKRGCGDAEAHERTAAQREVSEQEVPATPELVLHEDPARMSLWQATRYVLRIRTNVILIVTSALGYFYFAGVQTFGLVLLQGRYGVSHGIATLLLALLGIAALVGVLGGGRMGDRLIGAGRVNGRVVVGGTSYLLAAVLFLPALLGSSLALSLPFFLAAAVAFAAREPALDAARLDVMHHRLWGRAEAVRTLLRRMLVAAAPLLFGFIADQLSSARAHYASQHGFGASASAGGLHVAFLLLLVTLAASGLLTFRARRTYPTDVATAVASEEATRRGG